MKLMTTSTKKKTVKSGDSTKPTTTKVKSVKQVKQKFSRNNTVDFKAKENVIIGSLSKTAKPNTDTTDTKSKKKKKSVMDAATEMVKNKNIIKTQAN